MAIECRDEAYINVITGDLVERVDGSVPARIDCREYSYANDEARLTGGVQARHPQWKMDAREVFIRLDQETRRIRTMTADGGVYLEALVSTPLRQQPEERVRKFLGGLVEEGIPWKMWCSRLLLELSEDAGDIRRFEASEDVRIERGGNTGTGGLMRMPEGSRSIELSVEPVFELQSGVRMVGYGGARFVWDLQRGTCSVRSGSGDTGGYRIQLPEKSIEQFAPSRKP